VAHPFEGRVPRPFVTHDFCKTAALIASVAFGQTWPSAVLSAENTDLTRKPNIVLILADDLGYGDLGCYGQKMIRTPRLDRLASQGTRFTDCYAGSTVCAPSRCCLMTGLHTGHARVSKNDGKPLTPDDVTVAKLLHDAGYATAAFGKWGLGDEGTTGIPNRQGFDRWFGFLDQVHAHNYYPEYLWENTVKFPLPNKADKGVASVRKQYAPDLFTAKALEFLETNRNRPFFLYLPYTLPHANNEAGQQGMEVPSDEPYSDRPWPQPQKNHAAMITYLDSQVGKVLDKLSVLGLENDTVVLFSSDNGPHMEGGADPRFFRSAGPLRGFKRAVYEGGIRVPLIVRWPGKVPAGRTSPQVWAFWDMLPTLAAAAGVKLPADLKLDGISMLPVLISTAETPLDHPPLYWEFHERGLHQAARDGQWKAVRHNRGPLEIYDLKVDLAERHDIAAEQAEVVAKLQRIIESSQSREAAEFKL